MPGCDQFDGAHAAESADVADDGPAPLPIAGALLEVLAQLLGALAEFLLLDGVDHGETGGAGDGIAGEGAAQAAGAGGVHDLGFAGDGRERQSSAQRFRGDQDVGHKSEALAGEHGAGAGEAGLHFVGDQHDAVFVAGGAESGEELRRRNDEAAFAEHGFDDDGGDGLLRDVAAEEFVEGLRCRSGPGNSG